MTMTSPAPVDETEVAVAAERLFAAGATALETLTIALGRRLGLYAALAAQPRGSTFAELAENAGIHPRYAREWLEQQAAAEIVDVADATVAADERRYFLCPPLQVLLVDPASPAPVGPLIDAVASLGEVLPGLIGAYRAGDGIAYGSYPFVSDIQAGLNAPVFAGEFAQRLLPAVPGLVDRMMRAPAARIAEFGTGEGGGALAIARAWQLPVIDAFDLLEGGLEVARRSAVEEGVADRVRFLIGDVTGLDVPDDSYDVVFAVEVIHDLPRPAAALAEARRIVKPDGIVVIFDERVPDQFTAPTDDPVERLMYSISVLHCLPSAMHSHPLGLPDGAATGTVMRAHTFREFAIAAGFESIEDLPFEHDMLRGYLLR